MRLCRWSAFVPALLLTGVLQAQSVSEPPPPPAQTQPAAKASEPTPESLHTAILRRTLGAWWGAAFVTRHGQPVFTHTYGLANESLRPFDDHTLFDLGDNSKQFTSTAIMLLVQQGKLSLDDPLSKFYPDAPEIIKSATIRQLLGHASGISDKTAIPPVEDYKKADDVAMAIMASATRAPNAFLEYSQRAYNLAACIIEKVSGVPFDTFMRDQLFKPAGLKETGFLDGVGLNQENAVLRVASGRMGNPGRDTLFIGPEAWDFRGRGAMGVVSSIADMVAWEKALSSDSLLTKPHRDALYTIAMENYALGWYVQTTQRNTTRAWHGGASRGLVCLYFRLLDEDTSLFVITNENGEADRIIQMLEEQFFPAIPLDFEGHLSFRAMMGHNGGIEVEEAITWKIQPVNDGSIKLQLSTATYPGAIATLNINEGLARQMAAVLKDSLRTMPTEVAQISKVTVNPGRLPFEENGVVKFSDKARLEVRSGFRTKNEKGDPFTDRRPLLAVIDPEAQNWPLSVQMDPKTAEKFYNDLWQTVTTRPGPTETPAQTPK